MEKTEAQPYLKKGELYDDSAAMVAIWSRCSYETLVECQRAAPTDARIRPILAAAKEVLPLYESANFLSAVFSSDSERTLNIMKKKPSWATVAVENAVAVVAADGPLHVPTITRQAILNWKKQDFLKLANLLGSKTTATAIEKRSVEIAKGWNAQVGGAGGRAQ